MQVPLIRIASSPAFYVALLAAALLVNAAGYLFALWHERTLFDEAAHLFTSFSLVAAIGRLARGRPWLHIV